MRLSSCCSCPTVGMTTPIPVPAGTFSAAIGLATLTSDPCPTGYFCPPGSSSLADTACPAGRYGNQTGLSDPACSGACPIGYTCAPGTVNAYGSPCNQGTFGNTTGQTACHRCPVGTYSRGFGLTACIYCDPGRYSPTEGK